MNTAVDSEPRSGGAAADLGRRRRARSRGAPLHRGRNRSSTSVCLLSLLIVAGAIACGKGENSSTVDLIKTVATEARTKARVEMSVKMAADQPAPDDLALLKTIEDRGSGAFVLQGERLEIRD